MNWSREKRAEMEKMPYKWNHPSGQTLVVEKREQVASPYRVRVYRSTQALQEGNAAIAELGEFAAKSDAYDAAVDWAKKHENGAYTLLG